MFGAEELPLGAKALLLYQLEKLRNESPLPLYPKRIRRKESEISKSIDECDASEDDCENLPHASSNASSHVSTARKVSSILVIPRSLLLLYYTLCFRCYLSEKLVQIII